MTRLTILGLAAAATVAVGAAIPAAADEKKAEEFSCCSRPTTEARPGDHVDGMRIPNYVFVQADLNNDGVLRGKELRRARDRAIRLERGGRKYP